MGGGRVWQIQMVSIAVRFRTSWPFVARPLELTSAKTEGSRFRGNVIPPEYYRYDLLVLRPTRPTLDRAGLSSHGAVAQMICPPRLSCLGATPIKVPGKLGA